MGMAGCGSGFNLASGLAFTERPRGSLVGSFAGDKRRPTPRQFQFQSSSHLGPFCPPQGVKLWRSCVKPKDALSNRNHAYGQRTLETRRLGPWSGLSLTCAAGQSNRVAKPTGKSCICQTWRLLAATEQEVYRKAVLPMILNERFTFVVILGFSGSLLIHRAAPPAGATCMLQHQHLRLADTWVTLSASCGLPHRCAELG